MAVEEQELKLKVVLDDQASAGLARLKSGVTELTSGQAAASMEKFKRSQAEIGEGIKKLTELATGGERALLGFIGKFGALGVAAAGLGTVITSTALKLADLANSAKLMGVAPASMKNMVDQLEKAGVASDAAKSSVSGFVEALSDLSRYGSERYQKLLNMAGEHKEEMIASIAQLEKLGTLEEKYTAAQALAENVRKNRYEDNKKRGQEETVAQADANRAANEYLKILQLDPSTRLLQNMHQLSAEERKRIDETLANAVKVKKSIDELTKSSELVGESLVKAFGPVLSEFLKSTAHDVENIVKLFEKLDYYLNKKPMEGVEPLPHAPSFWDRFVPTSAQAGSGGFSEEQRQQALEKVRGGQGTSPAVGPGTGSGAGEAPAGGPRAIAVGPGTGAGAGEAPAGGPRAMESGGGSGGVTAPSGTPIQREGMATVTTPSGKSFQVDARYAENFKGFLSEYENAGGTIGSASGTLGSRPSNPSGHPIGTAIDINQVARDVRGGTGKSLDPAVEDELAKKWGFVSGHQWRSPDTGHFGIRSPEAARQALIDQGVIPATPHGQTAGPGAGKGAGETPAGKTVKGSWFGSGPGWSDPSEPIGRKTASGQSNQIPGIALPSREGLGKMFEVTTPDGRKFMLPQTDIGPAARTGRGIDITSSAATQMGYTAKDFPTDKGFSYRRADDDRSAIDKSRSVDVNATGKLTATINAPPGAKVEASGEGLFKNTEVNRQTQMQPALIGPPTPSFSERFTGE
jgi:hypothetical protein